MGTCGMDAEFLLNRLVRMSPMEIIHRMGDFYTIGQDRRTYGKLHIASSLTMPGRMAVPAMADEIRALLLQKADAYCNHCFDVFSLKGVQMGFPIRHEMDCKSGKAAPVKVFSGDLDYRDEKRIGDVKYIWEPARHLSLPVLALAWRLTGLDRYLHRLEEDLQEWIDANPYCVGIHWTSPLESGIRLINWTLAWQWAGDAFSRVTAEKLNASAALHMYHINRHYSRDSSANNHLIGEASGLLIASIGLLQCDMSEKWREKARRILLIELERQNYSDGVNKEQALSYQQFVLDFFLLDFGFCGWSGIPVPESAFRKLDRMLLFLSDCLTSAGEEMAYGDEDDGLVIDLLQKRTGIFASLRHTREILFTGEDTASCVENDLKSGFYKDLFGWKGPVGDGCGIHAAVLPSKRTHQWAGQANRTEPIPGNAGAMLPGLLYPEGGYAFLGKNFGKPEEQKLMFDFGKLGYLSLAAHGHADALSFIFAANGLLIFVDPGTYAYHSDRQWRNWFRSTGAHNTVEIDGRSQSVIAGNFMWSRTANCTLKDYVPYARVAALHDGYTFLEDKVVHERTIAFQEEANAWSIRDTLRCRGKHVIKVHFHMHPDVEVEEAGECLWHIRRGSVGIHLRQDTRLEAKLSRGDSDIPAGWYSPSYDVKIPAYTLCFSATICGNTEFIHTFSLVGKEVDS